MEIIYKIKEERELLRLKIRNAKENLEKLQELDQKLQKELQKHKKVSPQKEDYYIILPYHPHHPTPQKAKEKKENSPVWGNNTEMKGGFGDL